MTQFVQCVFNPGDRRAYTYANDGDPVAVGDEVRVPDPKSDGWKRVTVSAIDCPTPNFQCKPVLGLAPPVDADPAAHPDAAKEVADPPRISRTQRGIGGLFEGVDTQ